MQVQYLDAHRYVWSDFTLEDIDQQSYWVFDLEATGIDTATEQVIQVGGVHFPDDPTESTFASYVRPNKPIPQKIQALTGVTQKHTESAPTFAEMFPHFLEQCRGHVLVTQCGYEFDYPLLEAECLRHGLVFPEFVRLDTKAFFAFLHPELDQTFSTDFLAGHYTIETVESDRHDALGDASLISRILCAELAEAKTRGINTITVAEPITIRRFKLPPL